MLRERFKDIQILTSLGLGNWSKILATIRGFAAPAGLCGESQSMKLQGIDEARRFKWVAPSANRT